MASSCSSVKILEITQIKPSPQSSNLTFEASLPLTFFDTFWFTIPPVDLLFFYKLNELTPAKFSSQILPKLKQSLSLTLNHYPFIAGNLKWLSNASKPFISYTPNDGVSVTVAESDADFDRLASNGIYEAIELHPLTSHLITSDDSASIIALQITLFPSKGFSIGITCHHTPLDGKTVSMFMRSWAYLCRQQQVINTEKNPMLSPELIPSFDRESIKDPTGIQLDIIYLNQRIEQLGGNKSLKLSKDKGAATNIVRATVTITPQDFKKMRERVLMILSSSKSSDHSSNQKLNLSPFVLTIAYVTSCIVKARGGEGDRLVRMVFSADCRSRLDPPVPETYFGNCTTVLVDISKARDYMDIENGIAFAVEKASNMVKGLREKDFFEEAKDRLTQIGILGKQPTVLPVQVISVAGSPRFELYEADFGWGKPWKAVVVSIDKNEAISVAESRDVNGGIEIGLALKRHEMELFLSMFLVELETRASKSTQAITSRI